MSSNYGIKIAKDGKTIDSSNLDDYIFRSDIKSLPLIQKVEANKTISSGDCNGTYTYTHNLGAFLFTQIFLIDKSNNIKQSLPFHNTDPFNKFICDGDNFHEDFDFQIKKNSVVINYDVGCFIPQIGAYCSDLNLTYTFEISIYMFELGA